MADRDCACAFRRWARVSGTLMAPLWVVNANFCALPTGATLGGVATRRGAHVIVHETGTEWHLMSATVVMALELALLVTLPAQESVVKGLRI